jgi:hypothetical protein
MAASLFFALIGLTNPRIIVAVGSSDVVVKSGMTVGLDGMGSVVEVGAQPRDETHAMRATDITSLTKWNLNTILRSEAAPLPKVRVCKRQSTPTRPDAPPERTTSSNCANLRCQKAALWAWSACACLAKSSGLVASHLIPA